MQTIVSNPPVTTIYRCQHGSIHLVYQNINIGFHPNEFCTLNQDVQQAMSLIDAGVWPCPYVSLSYYTTVLCLRARELSPLAKAMQAAAEIIEQRVEWEDSLQEETKCRPERPGIAGLPRSQPASGKRPNLDSNHIHHN